MIWRNERHRAQWQSTLQSYAFPVLGKLPVAAIDTALVMKVLEQPSERELPLWQTRTETASRLRGCIEAVLAWATVRGYRQGDNPARWKHHLDKLLPARSKIALEAMPYADVPRFMARLRENDAIAAKALVFQNKKIRKIF